MIRVVLTDLDRTLTGPDLVPDADALDAVARLRRAGVAVLIVTGRPLDHMTTHGLDRLVDGIVAENGGVIRIGAQVATPGAGFAARARAALGPLGRVLHWCATMGSGPRGVAPEIVEALRRAGVAHAVEWNADEFMLLAPGVDKGSGARLALEILGVPPEAALAVGDGENDVAMFRAVGDSVAVGHAPRAVREAARRVARSGYARGFVEAADYVLGEGPRVVLTPKNPPAPRREVRPPV